MSPAPNQQPTGRVVKKRPSSIQPDTRGERTLRITKNTPTRKLLKIAIRHWLTFSL